MAGDAEPDGSLDADVGSTAYADASSGDDAGALGLDDGSAGSDGSDAGSDEASAPIDAGADACGLVTHSNGEGQTWQDCNPLGSYTLAEAQSACAAFGASGTCAVSSGCSLSYVGVTQGSGATSTTYIWVYARSGQSQANAGDVLVYRGPPPQCNNLLQAAATWR